MQKNKLAIIGMGNVGSAVLVQAVAQQLAAEIVCIDINEQKAHGEALDMTHATPAGCSPDVKIYSGGFEECKDASIIICAGGPSIMPDEKHERLILAKRNIKVIGDIMKEVTSYTRDAAFIMITNPLDVTTYLAVTRFDYAPGKLFGTGTTLETLRFKRIIANHYNVNAKDVQGFMLGEHGNSAFPAWSTVSIGGVRLNELDKYYDYNEPFDKEKIANTVVKTAYDVLESKGWTNTGIAMGACYLAKAVLLNTRCVTPVSIPLTGEYGLNDVALSLPSIIGENGVEKRLAIQFPDSELEALHKSAESIKSILRANSLI
ncbi:L-lactate dehydrogenase [Pectinatus cerevisiiphilus]|uniref:L-lactate dehydrogenase n=1 Tax=Pectinatus cerevisiiphilus TaxID=86956 RepID=A0A4V2URQ7_9FIRM|nr:L-lactate dehydrogenase [Pectinatus cerevisiiphilus]TCS78402.1 L-lactate dehydrogenase [Pectinatus cerevisiiphilus]